MKLFPENFGVIAVMVEPEIGGFYRFVFCYDKGMKHVREKGLRIDFFGFMEYIIKTSS